MKDPYQTLKEESHEANIALPDFGLVIYTFGNVSAFDPARGVFAIKPSGVSYYEFKVEDIVIVDLENRIVSGTKRPSSDTKTHTVLYKNLEAITGITHTHSAYAVAWAQAGRSIPIYGTTHADHVPGAIPCTPYLSDEEVKGDYETETGHQILKGLKEAGADHRETEMILTRGHGPFTWGKDAAKSVFNSRVLEELAKMALFTEQINPEAGPLKTSIIQKHYQRKHGKGAYYGQS